LKLIFEAFEFINTNFDPADYYKVDSYLYGVGLVVDPMYRGRGIATEILKTRIPFLKALDLTVTTTIFSAIGSQKSALAANFEENYSVSFDELQEKFPLLDLSHRNTSHCKTMSLKISK
jgi:GNAT superfamily N-acetyltransferase